jgi:6-phosphogluconolactonase
MKLQILYHGLIALWMFVSAGCACAQPGESMLVYIGTYTGAKSQGIYSARLNTGTGVLSPPQLAIETRNPTFLALGSGQRVLYAVNEVGNFEGKPSGAVSAFGIDKSSGKLTFLNQTGSGGTGPCHLALDKSGKLLLTANYGSGSIAAFSIDPKGQVAGPLSRIQHAGSSINAQRQEGPHAHFITCDPAERFVLSCDLGLDKVLVYRFDTGQTALEPNDPPAALLKPGAGPRHLAFHPDGRHAYAINELDSTITVFEYDSIAGKLTQIQNLSTLPPDFERNKSMGTLPARNNSCAEIAVHPSGKWVYGSNRGHNSIACFSVEQKSGKLSSATCVSTRGKTPRHFALDPKGKWLLAENQDSNDIFVFRIAAGTGVPEPVGDGVQVGSPVCLVFVE